MWKCTFIESAEMPLKLKEKIPMFSAVSALEMFNLPMWHNRKKINKYDNQ